MIRYTTLSIVPTAFYRIQRRARKLFPRGLMMLAGGCVRDFVCGKGDPKDYDLFFVRPHSQECQAFLAAYPDAINHNDPHYAEQGACYSVDNFAGYPVDVVFSLYDNGRELLRNFDIGICQCAWWNDVLITTKAFDKDQVKSVVRQRTLGAWSREHSNRRVERLGERYGWPTEYLPGSADTSHAVTLGELNDDIVF